MATIRRRPGANSRIEEHPRIGVVRIQRQHVLRQFVDARPLAPTERGLCLIEEAVYLALDSFARQTCPRSACRMIRESIRRVN